MSAEPGESASSSSGPDGGTAATGAGMIDTATDASTPADPSPAPLTSLSALLGGEDEGGAVCAADGTCD